VFGRWDVILGFGDCIFFAHWNVISFVPGGTFLPCCLPTDKSVGYFLSPSGLEKRGSGVVRIAGPLGWAWGSQAVGAVGPLSQAPKARNP